MASFSFGFSGDDIQEDVPTMSSDGGSRSGQAAQPPAPTPSAFPVQGKPLLPPVHYDLREMLGKLPSRIAYSTLEVELEDGGGVMQLPRRELWDVRAQLMAEADAEADEDAELEPGLGKHDVKSGIYEGGFKSWESSVDLVRVLAAGSLSSVHGPDHEPLRVVELGCGTALPSVSLFQRALAAKEGKFPLSMTLADYNPSVLHLVTLPNFLLAWALQYRDQDAVLQAALDSVDSELELTSDVKEAFAKFLLFSQILLSFVSGGWSPEFVDLLYSPNINSDLFEDSSTLLIGAETIYSPFALKSFSETLLSILHRQQRERPNRQAIAIVAAKRLYFGVGGSLDDFVDAMRASGVTVDGLREETAGVRRGVVQCRLG